MNGDAVLLREHDKYGSWLPVGGHIELDEDPAEAAIREAKEEVGLDVILTGIRPVEEKENGFYVRKEGRNILVPYFINRHFVNDTHEHISFEYFALSDTRVLNPAEGEKQDGLKWFTKEELDDPKYGIAETIRNYAKAALEALAT